MRIELKKMKLDEERGELVITAVILTMAAIKLLIIYT
jgi:hypothetical protein